MNKNLPTLIFTRLSKCLLTIFCTLIFLFSFAQIKFSAAVNNRTISKNDYLQIQFTVENAANVETIIPPSFNNFTVVSGPNQQTNMSSINGNVKQTLSIGFVLQPLSTGNFTIGYATAKADGKEYHSNPLNIHITNSTSSNGSRGNTSLSPPGNITLDFPSEPATHQFDDYILKKGENVAEKIKKNLFIKIDVSKKNCYVGEPIIATYKLYTRLKSESNVLKAPAFNGFSVSELEIPDNNNANSLRTEKYNGREYNVYTLRKVQLYPLQSGVLSLEPVEIKNNITFLKAEYADKRKGNILYDLLRDFADESTPGAATEQQTITVTCDSLKINVKPLPDANKPVYFKGAVGSFKISAGFENNNITTDDVAALKVIISGAGNIQLINAPNILWPQGIEGFESKSSESIDKFSVPLKGDKIFTFPFTVSHPGNYTITAINFSYFDISSQSYKTISTQPLNLHVIKGSGSNRKMFNSENNNPQNKNWYASIDNNLIYFIASILLFCVLAILFIKNKNGQKEAISEGATLKKNISERKIKSYSNYQPDPVVEEAFIIPANPLAGAQKKLLEGDGRRFYKELNISLHKYLAEKLKVPLEELTKKKINESMDKYNVGVGTTLLVNSLLRDIDLNLYAPFSSETHMHEIYEKASEAVSLLDKQLC